MDNTTDRGPHPAADAFGDGGGAAPPPGDAAPRDDAGAPDEPAPWSIEDFDDWDDEEDDEALVMGAPEEPDAPQMSFEAIVPNGEEESAETETPSPDVVVDSGASDEPLPQIPPTPAAPEPVEPIRQALFDQDDVPDFSTFTGKEYVRATTQEYAGLAEEVARASTEEAEQIAVAAEIPGLESGVVGLEDVVAAAGEDASLIPARAASDLPIRVLTALGLLAIFFGSMVRPYLLGVLVFAVLALAAGELYLVLQRAGHHPLTLFGLLGVAGALLGAWAWGPVAIPVSLTATVVATFLFYGVVAERSKPMRNAALTVLGVLWIGGMGAFAMDMLRFDAYRWMVAAIVVTTALMDVAQFFVGRRYGRRQLAPQVSPRKTVEGLAGGVLMALAVGIVLGLFEPFDLSRGLLIGAIVAVVAPLGDLAVSVVKRAIGVKDMGAILPGHGGVLDRIDAMVFVIPAAWVAFAWMGLV